MKNNILKILKEYNEAVEDLYILKKNKKEIIFNEIKKIAYGGAVQPLYMGTDSEGNDFEFTSSDIVSGKVKAKKIKKWKGRSLADRVMSKNFGKVKGKKKKK